MASEFSLNYDLRQLQAAAHEFRTALKEARQKRKRLFDGLKGHLKTANLVSFDFLASFSPGQRFELAPGVVWEMQVASDGRSLSFVTTWHKAGIIGPHRHDCLEEIKLIRGKVWANPSNGLITSQVIIPRNRPHIIEGEAGAKVEMKFYL